MEWRDLFNSIKMKWVSGDVPVKSWKFNWCAEFSSFIHCFHAIIRLLGVLRTFPEYLHDESNGPFTRKRNIHQPIEEIMKCITKSVDDGQQFTMSDDQWTWWGKWAAWKKNNLKKIFHVCSSFFSAHKARRWRGRKKFLLSRFSLFLENFLARARCRSSSHCEPRARFRPSTS
jgi:hypothetical protein